VCFSDDGYYRSFDGPSLVPSPDVNNLSPEERNAMQEDWRVELARVALFTVATVVLYIIMLQVNDYEIVASARV